MPRSIAHYTVLSGQATEARLAVHQGDYCVIVREMEERPGPGGRLGLGLCGLAGWGAGSDVAVISLETRDLAHSTMRLDVLHGTRIFLQKRFVFMYSSLV